MSFSIHESFDCSIRRVQMTSMLNFRNSETVKSMKFGPPEFAFPAFPNTWIHDVLMLGCSVFLYSKKLQKRKPEYRSSGIMIEILIVEYNHNTMIHPCCNNRKHRSANQIPVYCFHRGLLARCRFPHWNMWAAGRDRRLTGATQMEVIYFWLGGIHWSMPSGHYCIYLLFHPQLSMRGCSARVNCGIAWRWT